MIRPARSTAPSTAITRRIIHVSDIHFGSRGVEERAEVLLDAITALAPAVVAVSGDLTGRATAPQFRAARRFLDAIERAAAPVIVVPGNHDVPLQPLVRFRSRLSRYRAHVIADLSPFFADEMLAVVGMDTTRAFGIDGGRARRSALARLAERFRDAHPTAFRVVVAHHPFTRAPGRRRGSIVQKARRALLAFEDLGVDAVLTGHRHETIVVPVTHATRHVERAFLLVQAGTATTARGRRSERGKNSFVTLDVGALDVVVTRHVLDADGKTFVPETPTGFPRLSQATPIPV